MSNPSSVIFPACLIRTLMSSELEWSKGLLGERLADEVFPCLTEWPVLVVFWGRDSRFFSQGLPDGAADLFQTLMLSPSTQEKIEDKVKEAGYPLFRLSVSDLDSGAQLQNLAIPGEILVAPIGKGLERLSGILAVLVGNRESPTRDFENILSFIAAFSGSLIQLMDEIDSLESFLQLTYQIVDKDPSGIAICDSQGVILRANRAMSRLTGYPQAQLVRTTASRFFSPEDYNNLLENWRVKNPNSYEVYVFNRAGEEVPVRLSPYQIQQNERIWNVMQLEDLRSSYELKQKEVEVERLEAVFNAAVTIQDKVNTPLTVILAHMERLRLKFNAGISREDLDKSLESVERQVEKITKTLSRMSELKSYRVQDYALKNRMMLDISEDSNAVGGSKPKADTTPPGTNRMGK